MKLPRNDLREKETLDDLSQGRLRIYQKTGGFRYTIDALLLAHFAKEAVRGRKRRSVKALDLGSGTGVIPLLLSRFEEVEHIVGLEMAPSLVEMSRRSVAVNSLEKKIRIIEGDICAPPGELDPGGFDLVVSNPPYRPKGTGRLNPNPDKAMARHEIAVSLSDIINALTLFLKRDGTACLIYGAFRMPDLTDGFKKADIRPIRMRFIHSRPDEPAKMILIEARREEGTEINIDPPLIVYRDVNNYTDEVNHIFQTL